MFDIPKKVLEINPRVVLLQRGQKGPSQPGWPNSQLRAEEIHSLPPDPMYGGYGIVLDGNVVVFDIDVHDGQENGFESLERIKEDHEIDLWEEAFMIVRSPSGGAHLYFWKPVDLKLGMKMQDYPAIDVLSKGKQVVGPGSKHANLDGYYTMERFNPGPASQVFHRFENLFPKAEPLPTRKLEDAPDDFHDSPVDIFNKEGQGKLHLKEHLETLGYTFQSKGDGTYTYVRPGKTDHSFKISGTLGRKSSSGNDMLVNFSTSDSVFDTGGITVAEAYRRALGLSNSELPITLRECGYGEGLVSHDDFLAGWRAESVGEELEESFPTISFGELMSMECPRNPQVINGLLRLGETLNVIAPSKVGKSWFVHGLCSHAAVGADFVNYSFDRPQKCLIIDNELHQSELKFRLTEVGKQVQNKALLRENLHITCMRGGRVDINSLMLKLSKSVAGRFDIIVLDALYRFLPEGVSENDNAQMMDIYNKVDEIAANFSCAVICIHHSAKGNVRDRSVTDAGSGAGAISRACDSQIVLYPQETEDGRSLVDVEAVARSFPTPAPFVMQRGSHGWEHLRNEETQRTKQEAEKKGKMTAKEQEKAERSAKNLQTVIQYIEENEFCPHGKLALICNERTDNSVARYALKPAIDAGFILKEQEEGRTVYRLAAK